MAVKYFDDSKFFEVLGSGSIRGGIQGNPAVGKPWRLKPIPDEDPPTVFPTQRCASKPFFRPFFKQNVCQTSSGECCSIEHLCPGTYQQPGPTHLLDMNSRCRRSKHTIALLPDDPSSPASRTTQFMIAVADMPLPPRTFWRHFSLTLSRSLG